MSRSSFRTLLVVAAAALLAVPAATLANDTTSTTPTTSASPTTPPAATGEKPAGDTGVTQAISAITDSMNRQQAQLQNLLAKVPASAQPGIQKAIDATTAGREKALAALDATHGGASVSGTAAQAEKALGQAHKIVADARTAVDKDMKSAMANQPKEVRDEISGTMKSVHDDSGKALNAIQRADREERTESASAASHEHERGETGAKASMTARPSRPEAPVRR